MKRAVVLLSGGMDSATCLALARAEGYEAYALSFDYGQRHRVELEFAAHQAEFLGAAQHRTVRLDLRTIGGSALTADVEVPKGRTDAEMADGIPVTYVPARNTVFLAIALGWAEVLGAEAIFIGVNALDYSGYPDCRPAFLEAFQALASVATKQGVEGSPVRLKSPLLHLTKPEIAEAGLGLAVDFAWTTSCYDPAPEGRPCCACDACQLRAKAFAGIGMVDPLLARFGLA